MGVKAAQPSTRVYLSHLGGDPPDIVSPDAAAAPASDPAGGCPTLWGLLSCLSGDTARVVAIVAAPTAAYAEVVMGRGRGAHPGVER
jgi:hypothetical protein